MDLVDVGMWRVSWKSIPTFGEFHRELAKTDHPKCDVSLQTQQFFEIFWTVLDIVLIDS
jgi:hypothetical protein